MKRLFFALFLLPVSAIAQPAPGAPPQPSVQSQADAAALQATRLVSALAGQIATDQERIDALQKLVADLQAKLAVSKPGPAKKE